MPFAVVNRLIEEYNTNGISSVLRADNVLDLQISAAPHTPLALGDHQIAALKDNDILPVEYDGAGTLLAYKKPNGSWKVAKGTSPENPSVADVASRLQATYSGYNFSNVSLISLKDAFNDGDFKNPYITAAKTWRGGNSGWYDELTELAESVHGFNRSRWFNLEVKTAARTVKNVFKEIAKLQNMDGATTGEVSLKEVKTDNDETQVVDDVSSTSLKGLDIAAKFISAASAASELTCAAVEGFIGVQTVLSAYQRLQKINLTAGFMEAVQGVQAGGGSGDAMHEYANNLTTNDSETGKNAMNSAGMDALFNGTPISTDDNSVKSVNTENALSSISQSSDGAIMALFKDITSSAKGLLQAFKVCNYVKGGLAVVNMVFTVISVIPIFGQIVKGIQISIQAVVKAAVKAAISIAAPIIARELISYMGRKVLDDMATEWLGEDLGNALLSGGNTLLSANHQTGGGSPGSPAKVATFRREQERVIAEEAEYQRSIRSPFDISSQHTFLGNIVYSLIPMANSSGVGSTLKSISSVMTNSLSKILPTASAIAETSMVGVAKEGDCPILQNMEVSSGTVEIQADIYCNPIYISDQDTSGSDVSFNDVIEQELAWGYIEKDASTGKITIKDNTNMSKYITFCGQRTSNWGLADANIANAISQSTSIGVFSAIPIVGDAADIANAATNLANLPWTTGAACVASEANEYWCENRIHQRFVEDQRLLTDEGLVQDNPVATYLNEYYDKNPLDQSFEGVLARYSGMTKDDVIAALELIEGLTYLADYHPEERYAFGHDTPATNLQFEQSEEVVIATEPKYIVYNTLRNRAVLV